MSMKKLNTIIIALALAASPATADCLKDSMGRVYCGAGPCDRDISGDVHCSVFREGSAVKDYHGKIVCSAGNCMEAWNGDIVCSAEYGGAVLKGFSGDPVCQGWCMKASDQYCESRVAGEWR